MKTVYLEPNQVPEVLKSGYNGRKFEACITESITLNNTFWDGGTRSTYSVVELATGRQAAIARDSAPSWFGTDYNGESIALKPGFAVIEHSIFCGKDMGLTFHIHPDNAAKLLPQSDDSLSESELCMLSATAGLKSSYGGRKPRVDMMHRYGFSDSDIVAATESLKGKKLLRGNGSITPAGRNACQNSKYRSY